MDSHGPRRACVVLLTEVLLTSSERSSDDAIYDLKCDFVAGVRRAERLGDLVHINASRKLVKVRRRIFKTISDTMLSRTKTRLYRKLVRLHRKKGGGTWHLFRGNVHEDSVVQASKFVGIVSVHPAHGEELSRAPTAKDFERFVEKNNAMLEIASGWRCIGFWHDTRSGKHYLDISQVCFSYEQAANLGRRHKQEAIYLIKEDRSVRIR